MINLELTPKIKEWLDTDPSERDIRAGAELLLRINRNRILYDNIMRNPVRHAATLEYQMKKILKQRLIDTTHEEVAQMMTQVDAIARQHGFGQSQRSEFQLGKRADHDQLPPEVQQLYVDNADIDVLITLGDCSTQDERIRDVLESMKCTDIVNYSLRSASADAKYVTNNPVYPFAMMLGLTADELE